MEMVLERIRRQIWEARSLKRLARLNAKTAPVLASPASAPTILATISLL